MGRNDSGANGKVGETSQGRRGKWAKRHGDETTRGENESWRNDSGANGKVGETTRIRLLSSSPPSIKRCTNSSFSFVATEPKV